MRRELAAMKKQLFPLYLAILTIGSGCSSGDAGNPAPPGRVTNVEVYPVVPRTFVEHFSVPATVVPRRQVDLSMVGGGRVTAVQVDKGDRVEAGQTLLQTDTTSLQAAFDLAAANLEFQTGEFERASRLYEAGSINQSAFAAARLALAQARSERDIARQRLKDATLEAPFTGMITQRHVELGDVLGPGAPAFRLIDADRVKVQVGIPERLVGDFRIGNTVSIELDALPGEVLSGRLEYLAPEASPGVRTFLAEMLLDNHNGMVRSGLMGQARIQRRTFSDALLVPLDALIEGQDGRQLFVVRHDTLAVQRAIDIAATDAGMMVVRRGIDIGDRVVTKGQHELVDGDRVRVTGEYRIDLGPEVSTR